MELVLKEKEISENLITFYDTICEKMGLSSVGVRYNVTKIHCSKGVLDKWYSMATKHYSHFDASALWLMYGAKADIDSNDFIVVVDDDFVTKEKEEVEE